MMEAEEAGSMEIDQITLDQARQFAQQMLPDFDQILNFDQNFLAAQQAARGGVTNRRDMPVISTKYVKDLQARLEHGYIDLNTPYAPRTGQNPFPDGLKGEQAQQWLQNGLKKFDGDKDDDWVSAVISVSRLRDLKPVQRQIYFDKSIKSIAKKGVRGMISKLEDTILISSQDKYLIDGHHRWLAGCLINPKMSVQTLMIDLPMGKLLPLTLTYTDAIGKERNK